MLWHYWYYLLSPSPLWLPVCGQVQIVASDELYLLVVSVPFMCAWHFSGEQQRCLNSELWHACAGPLVSLPVVGSRVIYFPQGHSEQVYQFLHQYLLWISWTVVFYHFNLCLYP
jgi:hypothetical protein